MKLYDGGRAPSPRRVRIFLAEKGIEVPLVPVDLGKLEQKEAAFSAVNPYQHVPALELDDGTVITETVAICRYFEETHREPVLMGVSALEQAQVEMWQRRIELNLYLAIAAVFRHTHPAMKKMEPRQLPEFAEIMLARALQQMRFLDTELRERGFIAGERFTIADITALVALDFCKPAKIEIPEALTNLHRWYDTIRARPSANA